MLDCLSIISQQLGLRSPCQEWGTASLASPAEQVVFCNTDTLLCGRDLFHTKQPSYGIFDHHLQANPSKAHSKVSWVFLQTYLQPCRLQNRPLHWSFKPLLDQTETELIQTGKKEIRIKQPPPSLQLFIDRCPGCHYSWQTISANEIFVFTIIL